MGIHFTWGSPSPAGARGGRVRRVVCVHDLGQERRGERRVSEDHHGAAQARLREAAEGCGRLGLRVDGERDRFVGPRLRRDVEEARARRPEPLALPRVDHRGRFVVVEAALVERRADALGTIGRVRLDVGRARERGIVPFKVAPVAMPPVTFVKAPFVGVTFRKKTAPTLSLMTLVSDSLPSICDVTFTGKEKSSTPR